MARMHRDIDRVLISQYQIGARIREMAQQITLDHTAPKNPEAEITIVPILTGAMIFCGDLIRQLPLKMKIGLMTVSSYPGKSLRTQAPFEEEANSGAFRSGKTAHHLFGLTRKPPPVG